MTEGLLPEWQNVPKDISKHLGFCYIIYNQHTGRKYIGKKQFWRKIRRKPLKGTKRVRLDNVESDWKKYWGSCAVLQQDIQDIGYHHFSRSIISCWDCKWDLAYEELRLQVEHGVLFKKEYYNGIINIRLCKKK